ncbi:Similar to Tmcc2: Transmembrane and coiled-coil domains protein 2 (Mus musculus) [Cotesia congregata]|uniref:Similar to Tmcc2: Transmembrane and coiled-coil domains protein 2 (Mus musculus) n=1 Tax=Cotesia congregata TaxID=51543 RepID=A0A8J2MSY5_COTCN|nr:Similar to Tmcc2: Transmembrane and coiled-coil domains protein 2 (Mus musculus) [Cotesia congregata]
MASLTVTTSSKNSSRGTSPHRGNILTHHRQSSANLEHVPKICNTAVGQTGEGSTGSGESSVCGATAMKSSARQRSPGAMARSGDTLDETNQTNPSNVESEDFETFHTTAQSFLSNGSSELIGEDVDSSGARVRQAIEQTQNKITKTRELIRTEQKTRDENVNEYLKLAANADKQQLARIKTVFEKKNQKSAHNIAQLQKKLDSYTKKLRNYEMNGAPTSHRQPREVLRDMGQGLKLSSRNVGGNIRDGISGFSGSVMSKPREFAHLIKNKFGSADNINTLSPK